jgi:hypothetical protein
MSGRWRRRHGDDGCVFVFGWRGLGRSSGRGFVILRMLMTRFCRWKDAVVAGDAVMMVGGNVMGLGQKRSGDGMDAP